MLKIGIAIFIFNRGGKTLMYKGYSLLFNAITDALREMEKQNYGRAADILKNAQILAEEIYIDGEDDSK